MRYAGVKLARQFKRRAVASFADNPWSYGASSRSGSERRGRGMEFLEPKLEPEFG
jgi:hypothetical protein